MGSISIVLWLRTSKCTATIFCFHTNGSIHLGNTSASLTGYQRFHSWYISWQRTAQCYSATIHTTGLATLLLHFQDIRRSSICIMRIMNMQAELATFAVEIVNQLNIHTSIHELLNRALIHWGRDKMAAIFQTIFSNPFSWMKMYEYRLRFHWILFPRVQLTISQHWFRSWLGAG